MHNLSSPLATFVLLLLFGVSLTVKLCSTDSWTEPLNASVDEDDGMYITRWSVWGTRCECLRLDAFPLCGDGALPAAGWWDSSRLVFPAATATLYVSVIAACLCASSSLYRSGARPLPACAELACIAVMVACVAFQHGVVFLRCGDEEEKETKWAFPFHRVGHSVELTVVASLIATLNMLLVKRQQSGAKLLGWLLVVALLATAAGLDEVLIRRDENVISEPTSVVGVAPVHGAEWIGSSGWACGCVEMQRVRAGFGVVIALSVVVVLPLLCEFLRFIHASRTRGWICTVYTVVTLVVLAGDLILQGHHTEDDTTVVKHLEYGTVQTALMFVVAATLFMVYR